jgi:hypothetical protein
MSGNNNGSGAKRQADGSPARSASSVGLDGGRSRRRTQEPEEEEAILAFAARNRKNRFFIPNKLNAIGGIAFENVMIDSGCGSLLLPFPLGTAVDALTRYAVAGLYDWTISQSRGTGAVHSPVLKIKSPIGSKFDIRLGGNNMPFQIPFLRFHLGKQAADLLRSHDAFRTMLDESCQGALADFSVSLGEAHAPERRLVLLGQSFLAEVFSAQLADITVFLDLRRWQSVASGLPLVFANKTREAQTLVPSFEGFDDLEDEDHDGDADEEDVRRSWDPDEEFIDESLTY